jgi:tetratricopeptide (TPR) repeat protein
MVDNDRGKIPGIVWSCYLATVAVMLAASFFPEQRLWGFNWYGYFGWTGRTLLLVVALGGGLLARTLAVRSQNDLGDRSQNYYPVLALALLIVVGFGFYFARGRTHFLGDGYQLLAWLEEGIHHKPWEKGTFAIQDGIYSVLGKTGKENALLALQITSYAAGFVFWGVTALTASRLFQSTGRRLLYLIGVGTGGYALLFFGYLESYPLFVSSVGIFCQLGLLVALDRTSRWWLLPALGLAALFHIFAVALLPGAIYLIFRDTAIGRKIATIRPLFQAALAVALFAVGLVVFAYCYTNSYFFRFTIVALWTDRHTVDGYTMLSTAHLLDYLSQVFQLLPSLVIGVGLLWLLPIRNLARQVEYRFLLLLLAPSLAMTFIFNPGLGMPRDWDLFAFAGVPLAVSFYYVLLDDSRPIRSGRAITMLGIVLGLVALGPRVAIQIVPERGIALFDNLANLDRIKNSSGRYLLRQYLIEKGEEDEAERRRQIDEVLLPEGEWNDAAGRMIDRGQIETGISLLRRALTSDPSHYTGWANMGAAYAHLQQYDSALVFLKIADARMPFNSSIANNLGAVYYALKDYEQAEKAWLGALDLTPDDLDLKQRLLMLYDVQQRRGEYAALMSELAARSDAPVDFLIRAARFNLEDDNPPVAARLLERALTQGLDTNVVCDLQEQYANLQMLECDK